jgi:hypothetical protein
MPTTNRDKLSAACAVLLPDADKELNAAVDAINSKKYKDALAHIAAAKKCLVFVAPLYEAASQEVTKT